MTLRKQKEGNSKDYNQDKQEKVIRLQLDGLRKKEKYFCVSSNFPCDFFDSLVVQKYA